MPLFKLPLVAAFWLAMMASRDVRPGHSRGFVMAKPWTKKCGVSMKHADPALMGGDTPSDGLAVIFSGYTVNRGTFEKIKGIQSVMECFKRCSSTASCKTFAFSSSKNRCKLGSLTPYDLHGDWKKNQIPRFCIRSDSIAGYIVREPETTSRVVWGDTDSTQGSPIEQEAAIQKLLEANERTNELSSRRGSIF